MVKTEFTRLESEVLKWLLTGDEPVLALLRKQLASATNVVRNLTGQGFFLDFTIPPTVDKLHEKLQVRSDFCFGDVEAHVSALRAGIGFLVCVKGGFLSYLEGYTYQEDWPTEIETFALRYRNGATRNWEALRAQWETD